MPSVPIGPSIVTSEYTFDLEKPKMGEKTKNNITVKNLLMILFESDGTIFENVEGSDEGPIGILGVGDTEKFKK